MDNTVNVTDIAEQLKQQIPDNRDYVTVQIPASQRDAVVARLRAPAVGGEPQEPHGNFTERAIKLITEAAGHRDDWGKYEYAIIDLAREADAALPASPLRGRDLPKRPDSIYGKFHRDNWTDGDFAKHTAATRKTLEWLIELEDFLSTAPPEQPAAAPVTWLEIIDQCETAARGPVYHEIYNGIEGHNWCRDSAYGRGRHAAADAIRTLYKLDGEAKA